jgi:hypothetical protein
VKFVSFKSLSSKVMVLVSSVAALSGVACSGSSFADSSSSANSCVAYEVPAGTDLTSPVSFRSDVAPIFAMSCAFSSCHGGRTPGSNHGIFLGTQGGVSDAVAVRAGIVGIAAQEAPSMAYVTPFDPAHSYLMHKLDGDLCPIATQCVGGSCESPMPEGNDALPTATRDVIRRWIAQGAPNN